MVSGACRVFRTLLSVLILGEVLNLYRVIAITLVLGGIWFAKPGKPTNGGNR